MPALSLAGLVAAYLGTAVVGHGGGAQVGGWVLALAFGFAASAVGVAVIYRLFGPLSLGWWSIARGAVAAAGAIWVVSLGYVIFLNSGVDFQRRYATSGLAAVVLLAVNDQRLYSCWGTRSPRKCERPFRASCDIQHAAAVGFLGYWVGAIYRSLGRNT